MYGKGLLKGLGITFGHTFEKKYTIQYPEQMPHLENRFRGCLQFEPDKCIACGLCTKTCPNGVLTLETVKDPATNKKQPVSYTINLQYCMFCNLCVEICPKSCLYFDHNFELAKYNREDIKMHYTFPAVAAAPESGEKPAEADAGEARKAKQLKAMLAALSTNPAKVLNKLLENEEQTAILAEVLAGDEKKSARLAELMLGDRDKAKKVAIAMVNKELKDRDKAEGGEK
jgi:NADH-quinone oxidoreductase subunit I